MANVSLYHDSSADLGPFHGNYESHAVIQVWLAAAQALMLFIFPWLVALLDALHRRHSHRLLSVSLWELCLLDFVGLTVVWSYRTLWKCLSAKIAEGGEGASFLDQVRFQTASLVQGLVTLLIMSLIFVETSNR